MAEHSPIRRIRYDSAPAPRSGHTEVGPRGSAPICESLNPHSDFACTTLRPWRQRLPHANENKSPTASSSTATCNYAEVILTFAYPSASRTVRKRLRSARLDNVVPRRLDCNKQMNGSIGLAQASIRVAFLFHITCWRLTHSMPGENSPVARLHSDDRVHCGDLRHTIAFSKLTSSCLAVNEHSNNS